jgi:hypothetical protein
VFSSSSFSFEDLEEDQGDIAHFKLTQEQPPFSSFSRLHPEEGKRKTKIKHLNYKKTIPEIWNSDKIPGKFCLAPQRFFFFYFFFFFFFFLVLLWTLSIVG